MISARTAPALTSKTSQRDLLQPPAESKSSQAAAQHELPAGTPTLNKLLHNFVTLTPPKKDKHHHPVSLVAEKTDSELRRFFFKHEIPPYAAELEACNAHFYRIFAPHLIARTYAVWDKKKKEYAGVVSEEFPDFKSLAVDPLKPEDLNVSFIDFGVEKKSDEGNIKSKDLKNSSKDNTESKDLKDSPKGSTESNDQKDLPKRIPIAKLKELDNKIIELERQQKILQKQEDKIADDRRNIKNERNKCTNKQKMAELKEKDTSLLAQENKLGKEIEDIREKVISINNELFESYNVTEEKLRRYRIVKNLAISMTLSYIHLENDLHQKNLAKTGERIDFDMSMWPILYHFKESFGASVLRPYDDKVTPEDIINFPNFTSYQPYYWPTIDTRRGFSGSLNLSENVYPPHAIEVFKELENHPVFIHFKNETFAKYLLTNAKIYKRIAELHVKQESKLGDEKLIDKMSNTHSRRIEQFEAILLEIPEFSNYFLEHGDEIKNELINTFNTDENTSWFDPDQITATYNQLIKDINLKNEKNKNKLPTLLSFLADKSPKMRNEYVCYSVIKAVVMNEMDDYLKPGLAALGGFTRTQTSLAKEIKEACAALQPPKTDDLSQNIEAAIKLKDYLQTKLIEVEKEAKEKESSSTVTTYVSGLFSTGQNLLFKQPQKAEPKETAMVKALKKLLNNPLLRDISQPSKTHSRTPSASSAPGSP